jgi:hypothetical protein
MKADHKKARRQLKRGSISKEQYSEILGRLRQTLADEANESIDNKLNQLDDPEVFQLLKKAKTRHIIPTFRINGTLHRTHEEIATAMAGNLRTIPEQQLPPPPNQEIEPVTMQELNRAVNNSPTNSAPGPDNANTEFLKHVAHQEGQRICDIYTHILQTGEHPEVWKTANIVPIKKANKARYDEPKGWRSIHLISVLSKTLERIVMYRIRKNDHLLSNTQYGSREERGVSDAIAILQEWTKRAKDRGLDPTYIVADIEGGFDRVDPNRLGSRGIIPPQYMRWITTWSSNRRAKYVFNGRQSKEMKMSAGVPQGSPLSPYLFAIYISEIAKPRIIDEPDTMRIILSYVDDFIMAIAAKKKRNREIANQTWDEINKDAETEGMSFAANKTKTFHCNNSNQYTISGTGTPEKTIRILGYWFDKNGIGTTHLNHWTNKAKQTVHLIRAATNRHEKGLRALPTQRLLSACMRSQLHYGIEQWGNKKTLCAKADVFTYTALRRIYDLPPDTPTRAMSAEFGMVPTQIEYQYRTTRLDAREDRNRVIEEIYPRGRSHETAPPGEEEEEGEGREPRGGGQYGPSREDMRGTRSQEKAVPWKNEEDAGFGFTILPILEKKQVMAEVTKTERSSLNTDILAYTDGSTENGNQAAAVLYTGAENWTERSKTHTACEYTGKKSTILDAEFTAIILALEGIGKIKPTRA